MSENPVLLPNNPPSTPAAPSTENPVEGMSREDRSRLIIAGVVAVIILGLLITGAVLLFQQDASTTSYIRDIFIIFIALESLVIGVALVILLVQLAVLINLLQNEFKPMLKATNETVSTLRGTATFLSNNLAEPVIKLNEYLAGLQKLINLLKLGR